MLLLYGRASNFDYYKTYLEKMIDKKELDNIEYVLFYNICSKITYFKTMEECNNFSNGIANHGLSALLTALLENLRYIIEVYESDKSEDDAVIHAINNEVLYDTCTLIH